MNDYIGDSGGIYEDSNKNNEEKWTYHLIRGDMLKKVMISLVLLVMIITVFTIVITGGKKSSNSEEKLEISLAKSMEETEIENKKIEELLTKVSEELHNNGYEQIVSFSHEDRILTVQVQEEEFLNRNKAKIEEIIANVENDGGFRDFDVKFRIVENYITESPEQQKLNEDLRVASEVVSDLLIEKGHRNYYISLYPKKEILIEGTPEDLATKHELEKLIADEIVLKTNMNFNVKIQEKSENEVRDQEWQPVFTAIREETKKEFNEYRGFAYSFNPEPLQIIIKTNLEESKWFWNSNKKIKQMTEYVETIIELKRDELSIEEIPYEIIIRDKSDQRIN